MSKLSGFTAFLLGLLITFVVVCVISIVALKLQDSKYAGRVYPGITIDGRNQGGKSLSEAKSYYNNLNKRLQNYQLEIAYKNIPVATYSGQMLFIRSNGESVVDQAYLITRSGNSFNRLKQKIQILANFRNFSFTSNVEYDTDPIKETFAILEKQYEIEPKNALFEIKNGKVTAFSVEKNGLKINSDEAMSKIKKLLLSDAVNKIVLQTQPFRINVTDSILVPDVTLAVANTLGIEEIIGIGTSDYSGSIQTRVHNVLLATQRLHGTLIPQGEVFSFNKALGDVSGSTGYQPAYIILNGRTVLGDGGGVCQTSTTIFRAAIASGLPITQWAPHAYRVHYYENDSKPGKDATVYSPSQDLSFKNDTPAAILIQTETDIENNKLKYTFWGKKDDRKVVISDVTLGPSIPAPPAREEEDPTKPRGTRVQVDWAASGLNAWFDYKVTKGTDVIQEKRFVSNYRPWQAVFLVGTKD